MRKSDATDDRDQLGDCAEGCLLNLPLWSGFAEHKAVIFKLGHKTRTGTNGWWRFDQLTLLKG